MSSVSMQEGESSTFLLSVKLKEDHNLESLTGAVADWIKAMPVSAESIKFEAAYRSFSTLLIISMPDAMWCYFKRHPAVTCLGIVTPGPVITRNELNIAVKEKLALEQEEKRKQRQNPDADCYKQSYVDAFLLRRAFCPELDCLKESSLPSVENSLLSETESKGLPKLGGEACNASSTLGTIKVPGRSGSTFEKRPFGSAGSCRESYFPFHDCPEATPYASLQPSYNHISEQDSGKLGGPVMKRRQRQSSQGHTKYSSA